MAASTFPAPSHGGSPCYYTPNVAILQGTPVNLSHFVGEVPEPGRAHAGAIPEPATMVALGLAVAGLGGYVRKRRKA